MDILRMGMGRRLRGISGQEAITAFERSGYRQRKGKGSHISMVKPGGSRLTIPVHGELSVGLLTNQIKKAGLTVEEFLQLLGR
jgi:predicted RNA binding protein YcfA (HicA-like mRNA interferase family)